VAADVVLGVGAAADGGFIAVVSRLLFLKKLDVLFSDF